MGKIALFAALFAFAAPAVAQQAPKLVTPDMLTWQDHPVFKGAQTVILMGDPSKAEPIIQRVRFPANYRVPAHTHPYDEIVTVMTGRFGNAMDENAKGDVLKAGSVFLLPKGHVHHVWTESEETIVQISFTGPGGVTFANPADDPRKK